MGRNVSLDGGGAAHLLCEVTFSDGSRNPIVIGADCGVGVESSQFWRRSGMRM